MLADVRYLRAEVEEYRALAACLSAGETLHSRVLAARARRRAEELADQIWAISKMIAEIPDPEVRLIFELRYFHGYKWAEAASALPVALTADAVRLKHDRYLSKINEGSTGLPSARNS